MTTTIQGLPAQMQACQIVEYHKPLEIRTVSVPTICRSHEILIKVAAAGVCHSDLEYQEGRFPITLPVTGSHEGTGVVLGMGSDVKGFKVGDRIMVGQTFGRCGECEACKGPEKWRHYCPHRETMMSVGRNGAWQEYLVIDGREASHIPDQMSFATAAPLACAGVTSYRAVNLVDTKPGAWMGIVGSGGGLGHLAIQLAKAKGLKVVGVEARDDGLEISKRYGADLVVDARNGMEAAQEEVMDATDGEGCAVTLILSGHPTAPKTACAITKVHGTCVQVAIADPVSVSFLDLIFKNINLIGSFGGSQQEAQTMLNDFVKYGMKLENNLFHGLSEVPRACEMLHKVQYNGKGCIIVDQKEFKKDQERKRV